MSDGCTLARVQEVLLCPASPDPCVGHFCAPPGAYVVPSSPPASRPGRRPRRRTAGPAAGAEQWLRLLQAHYGAIRPDVKGPRTTEQRILAHLLASGGGGDPRMTVDALAAAVGRCGRRTRAIVRLLEDWGLLKRRYAGGSGASVFDLHALRLRLEAAAKGVPPC